MKNQKTTLEEYKKAIQCQQITQDQLIEMLYHAEQQLAQVKMVAAASKMDRHQLVEMFKNLVVQFGSGSSLRTVVNDIVDTFELELVKAVAENTEDNHCGGYGCMCGTD